MNGIADMGDGNIVTIGADGLGSHTYAAAGTYTVTYTPDDGNAPVSTVVEAVDIQGNPPWSWPADGGGQYVIIWNQDPTNDNAIWAATDYLVSSEAEQNADCYTMRGTFYLDAPGNPSARFDRATDQSARFELPGPGTYRLGFEPDPDLPPQGSYGPKTVMITVGAVDRSTEWIEWHGGAQPGYSSVTNNCGGWPNFPNSWTWSARFGATTMGSALLIPGSNSGIMTGSPTVGQRFDGGDGWTYEVGILESETPGYMLNGNPMIPGRWYQIGRVHPAGDPQPTKL